MSFAIQDFESSIVQLDAEKATSLCKELKSHSRQRSYPTRSDEPSVVGEKYEKGEYFMSELIMAWSRFWVLF